MTSIESQDIFLHRLLPSPILVRENGICGHLFVDGNLRTNRLLFRLLFDDPAELVPVVLQAWIGGKIYRYLLSDRDLTNPIVKSPVLSPEDGITGGLRILSISPLVSLEKQPNG